MERRWRGQHKQHWGSPHPHSNPAGDHHPDTSKGSKFSLSTVPDHDRESWDEADSRAQSAIGGPSAIPNQPPAARHGPTSDAKAPLANRYGGMQGSLQPPTGTCGPVPGHPGSLTGQPGLPSGQYGQPSSQHGQPSDQHGQHGQPSDQHGQPSGQHGQYGQPSNQYGQPSVQYGQPSVQYGQQSGQYGPSSGQHGLPSGQHGPPSGEHGPPTAQHGPLPGQHGPPPGQHGPPPGQHMPPPGQHGPPSGQHRPPSSQHGPPPGQHGPPPPGQHGPPSSQHGPPPSGQHGPPSGQHGPQSVWPAPAMGAEGPSPGKYGMPRLLGPRPGPPGPNLHAHRPPPAPGPPPHRPPPAPGPPPGLHQGPLGLPLHPPGAPPGPYGLPSGQNRGPSPVLQQNAHGEQTGSFTQRFCPPLGPQPVPPSASSSHTLLRPRGQTDPSASGYALGHDRREPDHQTRHQPRLQEISNTTDKLLHGRDNVAPSESEEDQGWVQQWLSIRRIQPHGFPRSRNRTNKVGELRASMHEAVHLKNQLVQLKHQVQLGSLHQSEATNIKQTVQQIKKRLAVIQLTLEAAVNAGQLQEGLKRRASRRICLKRRRMTVHEDRAAEAERGCKLHQQIDNWQQSLAQKQQDAQQESQVRALADQTLGEIRRKLADVTRRAELLKAVRKLRQVRKDSAQRKGLFTPRDVDQMFEERLDNLTGLIQKQTQSYQVEHSALKVMLEEEEEVNRERQKEEQEKLLQLKCLRYQNKLQQLLFGVEDNVSPGDPLLPFRQYYDMGNHSLQHFLQIRRDWDLYCVPESSAGGCGVPAAWVYPSKPSSKIWATAQSGT